MPSRKLLPTIVVLILLAGAGALHGQSGSDGTAARWRYVTGGTVVGTPAIDASGNTYLAVEDRYLYALAPDGSRKWRFDIQAMPVTAARISESGIVFVASADRMLRGISGNGRLRFQSVFDAPIRDLMLRGDATLEVLLYDGRLIRISDLGRVLYSRSQPLAQPRGLLGAGPGMTYIWGLDRREGSDGPGGAVAALGVNDTLRWEARTAERPTAAGLDPGGALLLGTAAGTVYRFGVDGARSVMLTAGDAITAVRSIAGESRAQTERGAGSSGAIAALDGSGRVYMAGEDGTEKWRAAPPEALSADIAFSDGGALLIGNGRGQLFVLSLEGSLTDQLSIAPGEGVLSLSARDGLVVAADRSWISAAFSLPAGTRGGWRTAFGPPDNSANLGLRFSGADAGPWWAEDFDYLYLRDHLFSVSERDRSRALEEISRRIERRELRGSYDYVAALLRRAVVAPFRHPRYQDGRIVNDWPEARERAALLLTKIATSAEREFFLRALRLEYDWEVRAAIVGALREIAIDPDGTATATIAEIVQIQDPNRPSRTFLSAAIAAFRSLWIYAPQSSSDTIVETLEWIRDSNAPRPVREQAAELLQQLSDGDSGLN